jgi:peptide-methionine (R)-S-oxide reductase
MKLKNKILLIWVVYLASLTACAQQKNKEMNSKHQFSLQLSEEEWKKKLSNDQYYILRNKGTERPYTGALLNEKKTGIYLCAGCDNELFTSNEKFDSHCGWPSFFDEIEKGKIVYEVDRSHGMVRTEIMCAKCGGHLGHVFNDGPPPTGLRYCVNSLSLKFVKKD